MVIKFNEIDKSWRAKARIGVNMRSKFSNQFQ